MSAWHPKDPTTWLLETVWVMLGLPLAVLLRKWFPLSDLLCCLLAAHVLVLIVGGHSVHGQAHYSGRGFWPRSATTGLGSPMPEV